MIAQTLNSQVPKRHSSLLFFEQTRRLSMGLFNQTRIRYLLRCFERQFNAVIANDDDALAKTYQIRHNVFADELGLEPTRTSKLECNASDDYSVHVLMSLNRLQTGVGTVRVVSPVDESHTLPIEQYCAQAISSEALHPSQFPRDSICEISRLAIPRDFRRRSQERISGAELGCFDPMAITRGEYRVFPFIALNLFLSAAAVVIGSGREHVYAMLEPRLARHLNSIGIRFRPIGEVMEYHGKRAPYYISASTFEEQLPRVFRRHFGNLLRGFQCQLARQ